LHATALTNTGRIFTVSPASFQTGFMPGINFFWTAGSESQGKAVAVSSGLAIDGESNAKHASLGAITNPALWILNLIPYSKRAQGGIVKLAGSINIVCPQNHMTEHSFLLG